MYNFFNAMRTPALIARVVSSIVVLFLSLAPARVCSLEVYRYVRKKFSFVRVDLSDRSRLLRECIVSSASSLCVYRLFLLCGPREQMCVLLGFCEERDSFPLSRSLAKRTKKRERNTRAAYEPQHFLIADISVVCTGTPKN
jgi:hypothetical protein